MRILANDKVELTPLFSWPKAKANRTGMSQWLTGWVMAYLLLTLSTTIGFAQAAPQPPKPLNIAIENVDVAIEPRKVIFTFSVTYDGFVEVSVFKKAGDTQKRIWKTQASARAYRKTGTVLNYKPTKDTPGYGKVLPAGTYYYEIYYKGVTRKGTFSV
jgi:hypothetical protein